MFALQLIKQVLNLSIETSLGLKNLVEVVGKVKDIGMPPLVEKESLLRKWLQDSLILMDETGTPIEPRDRATQIFDRMLESNTVWKLTYKYVNFLSSVNSPRMASELADLDSGEQRLAESIAKTVNREFYYRDDNQPLLSSSMVIIIVREAVEILKMWRSER